MHTVRPSSSRLMLVGLALAAAPAQAQLRAGGEPTESVAAREPIAPLATTTATTGATTSTAARGRYRVTLTGGRVDHETVDNWLQTDGKRDEIYFTVDVQLLDKATGSIAPFATLSDRTRTYGDVNGFRERVRAGTASTLGGLRTGDQFPLTGPFKSGTTLADRQLPLRLWEGELIQGQNGVIVTPVVWEYDGTNFADAATGWMNFARDFSAKLAENKALDQVLTMSGQPQIGLALDIAALTPTLYLGVISNLGRDGDRPIGMTVEGDKLAFKPHALVLNYDRIEAFLNSSTLVGNAPKGFYPLTYREPMSNKLEGDYTLYLHIERVP